jgi:putative ABC transport system permease protein
MVNEMQVRRKEVSILRAVGMSKKKLNRMLILERVIMGLIAWIIGTVLGLALSSTMLISILYLMETSLVIPWIPCLLIGAGVIGIMVLLSMGMVISLGKMDITEGIRNQE